MAIRAAKGRGLAMGRRFMTKQLGWAVILAVIPAAQAADVEAGKAKVAAVCAAATA
jgi:hypothetical protein